MADLILFLTWPVCLSLYVNQLFYSIDTFGVFSAIILRIIMLIMCTTFIHQIYIINLHFLYAVKERIPNILIIFYQCVNSFFYLVKNTVCRI